MNSAINIMLYIDPLWIKWLLIEIDHDGDVIEAFAVEYIMEVVMIETN